MQLAGAQNECLWNNHLKIHKVGNDASRCRDLCVGVWFYGGWSGGALNESDGSGKSKSKCGHWVRLVFVINLNLNASANCEQELLSSQLVPKNRCECKKCCTHWNANQTISIWHAKKKQNERILFYISGALSTRPSSELISKISGRQRFQLQFLRIRCRNGVGK